MSKLKEGREKLVYSLDDVANKLKIRKQYLIALEEENYDIIPGKIYVEGYKKMYYEFLGIEKPNINNNLIKVKATNGEKVISKNNKYKKPITIGAFILLILVILLYNFLYL